MSAQAIPVPGSGRASTTSGLNKFLQIALFWIAIALAWEFGVKALGIRAFVLPPLSKVLSAGWQNLGLIVDNTLFTGTEVLIGFLAATVGGILLGLVIYFSEFARRTLYPLVTALQSMPKIALAPLMIVWFGYGMSSKIAATLLFALFPIVIATLGGLSSVPANLEEHFRALGAPRWETFWRLRVPAALPSFVDGVKIAMPLAVIGAIVGEFIGAEEGLGHLITMATSSARTDLMFAAILAITLLAMALHWIVERAGMLVWWRGMGGQ